MAKKIRQAQVQNLSEDLSLINNKKVKSTSFSGTTTKTLTVTFEDDTTITSTFSDLNTTYPALTEGQITAGTATTASTISAKILADYVNLKLSAVIRYKGTVSNYIDLPPSDREVGDLWNIENEFAVGGEDYPAGSNVAWDGTKWDILHGFIDTSAFLTEETDPKGVKSVAVSGTDNKTITITLRDDSTITGSFTDKDTLYTAGNGLTLTGGAFSLPVTVTGSGTYVSSVTQTANGLTVNLGTPPNTNTTYPAGTTGDLETGSSSTNMVWSASVLTGFLNAISVTVSHSLITVTGGMISGGNVTISPTPVPGNKNRVLLFLNGVKQPLGAYSMNGNNIVLVQASLPTPIIADDEIEVYYI